jgi:thioredoxin 1
MAENGVVTITTENFQSVVLESDKPVLVDFWADWCRPCHMIAPVIEEIAKERAGSLVVGKLNVDENQELAIRYRVQGIPFIGLFEHGRLVRQAVGAMPKAQLLAALGL